MYKNFLVTIFFLTTFIVTALILTTFNLTTFIVTTFVLIILIKIKIFVLVNIGNDVNLSICLVKLHKLATVVEHF